MSELAVQHQAERQRFVVQDRGAEAQLEYRMADAHTVDFHHTFVPKELRGQGLAEALVQRGFEWAREEGYDIRASCSYAARFLGSE